MERQPEQLVEQLAEMQPEQLTEQLVERQFEQSVEQLKAKQPKHLWTEAGWKLEELVEKQLAERELVVVER